MEEQRESKLRFVSLPAIPYFKMEVSEWTQERFLGKYIGHYISIRVDGNELKCTIRPCGKDPIFEKSVHYKKKNITEMLEECLFESKLVNHARKVS